MGTESRTCEICGNDFTAKKSSTQRFCCITCQHIWQSRQIGCLSSHWNQETIECDWCHSKISRMQSVVNNGKHHFCDLKCRRNWFAQVWSQSEDTKKHSQERTLRMLSAGEMPRTDTAPQRVINKILTKNNVPYQNEYRIGSYSVDIFLNQCSLVIEIMGDFWHCNPLVYKNIGYSVQMQNINRDRIRSERIEQMTGKCILFLWESDIMNNSALCEALITQYIEHNGELQNYHSFNYQICEGSLCLNNTLHSPYFEVPNGQLISITSDN